jgi:hypothetical protein
MRTWLWVLVFCGLALAIAGMVAGGYGKGWIAWNRTFARDQKNVLPAEFRAALLEARQAGDRTLVSRTASSN